MASRERALPVTIRPGRAVGARAVRRELEQLFSSADFDAARRSREFLRFVVEEALAGRGEDLTQLSIATHVFGRRDDFDAIVDPIVRIQAGRLRRSLERYYMLSGKDDEVRIDIPRGTYIPAFRPQALPETVGAEEWPVPAPQASSSDDWPSVVISAFEAVPRGASEVDAASHVTEALVLELGRYRGVRAVLQSELEQHPVAGRRNMRFALGGRLRVDAGGIRVTTQLVDRTTGEQVWGDDFHALPEPEGASVALADVGRVIAARVGGDEGVLVQMLAAEHRKRRPVTVTPFGAVLQGFEFIQERDPASLAPALAALRQAVRAHSDSGVAWTWLARVCGANYAFEITAIPTPIEETIRYAQKGAHLEPDSRHARCTLAMALLVQGEVGAARAELEDALRLSPDSLARLEIIGFLLTLAGDWTRGPALIRTAQQRNPYWLTAASIGLWADRLRRGEVELAYQHALEMRDPIFFWRSVMRLSCLGLLGRAEEAAVKVADLLRHKPDFAARGRILIGYHLKDEAVMERVVDGLGKAGLTLD